MISIEDFDRNEIFKMLGNTGIEKKKCRKSEYHAPSTDSLFKQIGSIRFKPITTIFGNFPSK